MQQQQQQQGGPECLGGYTHPQGPGQAAAAAAAEVIMGDPGLIAEAASPISSRPPAAIGNNNNNNNFEELMRVTSEGAEGVGGSSMNRWPRQETLALLQVRSEMDAAFRDATLKAPLWEQVSSLLLSKLDPNAQGRKLGELGYTRSGKKCKEKFENVQKYYKRTKEGGHGSGRQDGKSYKFFTQLEALHHTPTTTATTSAQLVHKTNPNPPTSNIVPPPPDGSTLYGTNIRLISFSSNSSDDDDDDELVKEMEMDSADDHNRKRKRSSGDLSDDDDDMRMMDLFEGLMKQVMQKQEAMQQKFLEAIDKRDQDRMIREEDWKRQDIARLARQHHLMAQERAISASRDAATIAFLQKITGQSINLPDQNPPHIAPADHPHPFPVPNDPQQHQHQHGDPLENVNPSQSDHPHQPQTVEIIGAQKLNTTTSDQIVTLTPIPEQHIIPAQDFTSLDITSPRWPKTEVLALIQLRSCLESKYQEAGPKGPLWEEISAAMQRMGYNRSAKRCKEKWENINKYFKKVKESNKKRFEDAKTCPYFHELDALYRKKVVGNTSSNVIVGSSGILGSLSEQQGVGIPPLQSLKVNESEAKYMKQSSSTVGPFSSSLDGQQSQGTTTTEGEKQPEDMLKKQQHLEQSHGSVTEECSNNFGFSNSDGLHQEINDEDDYVEVDETEEYDDKTEEEMKMAYKIQFQRHENVGSSSGSGTSFMAMVK
ncbi:hypothetical protein BUALT_Bualt10G0000600 [Buddleja alternifolia]|uniref:Myb-like domain-containing protein n=1 Tax=Buddleja alternifolia TaxID=168488 RepID=A0AAV6WW91_9LAMI|nr:hypothetical protein BUALT_Bualt10G0000600 [Buddleja alternifolia]